MAPRYWTPTDNSSVSTNIVSNLDNSIVAHVWFNKLRFSTDGVNWQFDNYTWPSGILDVAFCNGFWFVWDYFNRKLSYTSTLTTNSTWTHVTLTSGPAIGTNTILRTNKTDTLYLLSTTGAGVNYYNTTITDGSTWTPMGSTGFPTTAALLGATLTWTVSQGTNRIAAFLQGAASGGISGYSASGQSVTFTHGAFAVAAPVGGFISIINCSDNMNYFGLQVTSSTTTTTTVTYPAGITPPASLATRGSITSCMNGKYSDNRGSSWSSYLSPIRGSFSASGVGSINSTDDGTIITGSIWGQYAYMSTSSNTFTQSTLSDMTSGTNVVASGNTVIFNTTSSPSSIYVSTDNAQTFSGPYASPFTGVLTFLRKIGTRYITSNFVTTMVSDATKDIYVTTTGTKVPTGTYRNLGTVDNVTGKSLWIRTA
jgi:hypothetical protein